MASIKEAYDSTIGENFTGLKLVLWAIPLYYCRNMLLSGSMDAISTLIIGVFIVLLLGFITESAYNACEKKEELVPGLNFFSMAFSGIKTIVAMSVYFAIAYLGTNYIFEFINLENAVLARTIKIMTWLIIYSLPVSAYVVFIRKMDIFDALNLKKIFYVMGETFMMFSYLIIKLSLLSAIVIGFVSYLFWLFVGLDNCIINYIWCLTIMYNILLGANYLAQFSEEWMSLYEKKNKPEGIDVTGAKLY